MSNDSGVQHARLLLDIWEQEWEPRLRGVSLAAEAEIPEGDCAQIAAELGLLYSRGQYSSARGTFSRGITFLAHWPACLVASMTGVAVADYQKGTYWSAFWRKTGYAGSTEDQQIWGSAFARAAARLGLPTFSGSPLRYVGPILMHAGIPAYCLGDFFRLLAERRRQDPGLDADSFLAWATASGRGLRLSMLDKPAQRFLLNGGDYAHDIVDRTLDLLDRLTEPDPDFDAVRLPGYMVEASKTELAAGRLDLSAATRLPGSRGNAGRRSQAHPRIALDPYGQGVHVLLPAVGDTPDGVARWRITADGETSTVQSRAMWVGAAETTPETVFPLDRPVRSVVVSLGTREDLAAELNVIDPADPILFFGDDGRRLSAAVSLPRHRVWIMHPADTDLEFTGGAGQVTEPAVPFGWDGWRLRSVSLENVQSVGLAGGRSHEVEVQARPRLLLGEPLAGVTTPFGSPVYSKPPQLQLPQLPGVQINWYAEIRRVGDTVPLVGCRIDAGDTTDIWDDVPRPVLGAFEVTVRGPLGRGLRRIVFVAEGLSIAYQPRVRVLTGTGLDGGVARLTAGVGANVQPASLRFGPAELARPVEYRTPDESEPLVVTPPHAELLCPGAGVTTWTPSLIHLVTEDFAESGRLLVRIPPRDKVGECELAVQVRGRQVQTFPSSGQQSSGLTAFELARAADTVAAAKRAELTVNVGTVSMPVALVRPRRLASGADLAGGKLLLHDAVIVDGLTAGVYLAYAPWRPPTELTIEDDGTVILPEELRNAGPLRVLLRIDDPWTVSSWPAWPGTGAYACPGPGVPASGDAEEAALSQFVAGEGQLPSLTHHLGWLWRLVDLAPELAEAGAHPNLAARCTAELRRRPRASLLCLADGELSQDAVVHALISTGLASTPSEQTPWDQDGLRVLERLWAALPAAAAIVSGDMLTNDNVLEAAIVQCGGSLTEILKEHSDPHASVGRFDKDAERMALLPPEQVEALWQAAAVVPQAMLDADTRATAARRMFEARYKQAMRAAAARAREVTRAVELTIRRSRDTDLADAITARQPTGSKGGWLALPAMSIAMALAARLGARGNRDCTLLEQEYRGKWANIAMYAPQLVAIDLVLAEALVHTAVTNTNRRASSD